jgi:hypothetical protein
VIAFFALVSLVLVRALHRRRVLPVTAGPGHEIPPLVRPLLVELHRRRRLARCRRRGRRSRGHVRAHSQRPQPSRRRRGTPKGVTGGSLPHGWRALR